MFPYPLTPSPWSPAPAFPLFNLQSSIVNRQSPSPCLSALQSSIGNPPAPAFPLFNRQSAIPQPPPFRSSICNRQSAIGNPPAPSTQHLTPFFSYTFWLRSRGLWFQPFIFNNIIPSVFNNILALVEVFGLDPLFSITFWLRSRGSRFRSFVFSNILASFVKKKSSYDFFTPIPKFQPGVQIQTACNEALSPKHEHAFLLRDRGSLRIVAPHRWPGDKLLGLVQLAGSRLVPFPLLG